MSGVTRRGLLGAGAAAAGAAALGSVPDALAADGQECTPLPPRLAAAPPGGRIDVHAHHIPDVYREAMVKKGLVNPGQERAPTAAECQEIARRFRPSVNEFQGFQFRFHDSRVARIRASM